MNNVVYITRKSDTSKAFSPPKKTSTAPLRCDRYFKLSNYWYFTTREGATLGPYDSKEQAQLAVADYIQFVTQTTPTMLKVLAAR